MSKDGAISGAYANTSSAQLGDNLHMHVVSHSSDKNNECVISWETLIKCVKAKYLQANQIKTILNEAQEIASCYVNLATVEEKKQKEKEKKKLAKESLNQELEQYEQLNKEQKLNREEWLNSYEEIHGAKTSILPQDIFKPQDKKELKCQLILGRAGIGKSTLCQYLAYQWAKEGWWKDAPFKLLVWIPLRQLTNESIYPTNGNAITLGKLFYERYKRPLSQYLLHGKEKDWIYLVDKLIKEHSSEILYLLDGFDEVIHVYQLDTRHATRQTEILRQLLKQEQVVITSRPYYIDNYFNTQGLKIDRCLENIGFIDRDIQNYVQRYFQEQPELKTTLQSLLNSHHLIKEIAHIPINLALLCRYWSKKTVKKDHYFTITDLYEELVGDLLYEYLGKGKGTIDFKDESGEEVLENAEVQPILRFLEKLAFLQMQEDSLLISQERIYALSKELKVNQKKIEFKKVLGAGLLVSPDSQEKRFEQKREYSFIHLTFQEFLAACYIAHLFKKNEDSARTVAWLKGSHQNKKISSQPLALFMQNHKYDLRYEIVWWFVAGLLKNHREGINNFFNSLCSAPRSLAGWYDVLLLIKCLEESKLTPNLDEALKKSLVEEIRTMAQAALDRQARISDKQYSKTFFEYLYASPMMYEILGILQTQEAVREALGILAQHLNLPSGVVEKIAKLLRDKNKKIKCLALRVLGKQQNLSDSLLNEIVKLLCDKEWDVRCSAQDALGQQQNLSNSLLNEIVKLLRNEEWDVRYSARDVLGQQQNLSNSILNEIVKLLQDEKGGVRCAVLSALGQQQNLSGNALNEIVKSLRDKEWDVRCWALDALGQQQNLSDSVLNEIVKLLCDEERDVKGSALRVLGKQQNLSDSVLNEIVKSIDDEERVISSSALWILGQQQNLSVGVLKKIVKLLRDKEEDVRSSVLNALGQQQNLSDSVVNEIVKSLLYEKGNVKRSALWALGQQQNLSVGVLKEIVKLLRDEEKNVRSPVLDALSKQPNLLDSVLKEIVKLLNDENWDIRYAALEILNKQSNLSISVFNKIAKLLNDKISTVRRSALNTLGKQQNLSDSVLKEIVHSLCDENECVRNSALSALGKQSNLSDSILNKMRNLLRDEKCNVRHAALKALGKQQALSDSVLNEIVKLLCDEEWLRRSALQVLGKQPNLSDGVLKEAITLISDKKSAYDYNDEEISFINQQLISILTNSGLISQLSSTPTLLSTVILQNVFSNKNVVYFKNNQSLILRLGQQLKEIAIKDKNEFIQAFSQQQTIWLNNRNTTYLLTQITNPLSTISLKDNTLLTQQNVINQNRISHPDNLNFSTSAPSYQTRLMTHDNKQDKISEKIDNQSTSSNSNKPSEICRLS